MLLVFNIHVVETSFKQWIMPQGNVVYHMVVGTVDRKYYVAHLQVL